jgi:hypothetical protein
MSRSLWTAVEVERLRKLAQDGLSLTELAREVGRSMSSIRTRAAKSEHLRSPRYEQDEPAKAAHVKLGKAMAKLWRWLRNALDPSGSPVFLAGVIAFLLAVLVSIYFRSR